MKKFKRILIANRGEIAVRIIRACKELGIETVSVYSKKDEGALHSRLADYSICIGNASSTESYLNSYNILSAAVHMQVDAIHPGIGFFAEDGDFAELCEHSEIAFIGAESSMIRLMGNKIEAKRVAKQCNVNVIEGNLTEVTTIEECYRYLEDHELPIILKAANGGGGKGIRIIYHKEDIALNLELCKKEASKAFGSDIILIEKYIKDAKHIEVQVLADQYGNVIHLGERECSIQRSNQKLIEETQCTNIDPIIRDKMFEDSIKICKHIGYKGPGTIEYLLQSDGNYYFMEMNTRLQVEHTVTEMLTGVDIVKEQIRIAEGNHLSYRQEQISFHGYVLQCRIIAEKYRNTLIPSTGRIKQWHMPGGFGVRIDSGYDYGDEVTPYYDSLLAKICCQGEDKEEAVQRMVRCLNEIEVDGVETNVPFLNRIIKDNRFMTGEYATDFITKMMNPEDIRR